MVLAAGPSGHDQDMLPDRQLDLFAASGFSVAPAAPAVVRPSPVPARDLDDTALVAAIVDAGPATCHGLAEEAGRRRLVAALPALEALCRRFKGFGLVNTVPEQDAALQGLVAIGGAEAAAAVVRLIVGNVVHGPGLGTAIAAAAELQCRLPPDHAAVLLRHPDPNLRRNAARCAPPLREPINLLIELLDDLNRPVATAAACALGRMGRTEARPLLIRLLIEAPSAEVINAVIPIADDVCIVTLGRIARNLPDLAAPAIAALDDMDNDRAAAIVSALRQSG
jgi:hypothetical protein